MCPPGAVCIGILIAVAAIGIVSAPIGVLMPYSWAFAGDCTTPHSCIIIMSANTPPRVAYSCMSIRRGSLKHHECLHGGVDSRRRDCHFAGAPSWSLLKRLLKGEGGAAERQPRRWRRCGRSSSSRRACRRRSECRWSEQDRERTHTTATPTAPVSLSLSLSRSAFLLQL